MECIVYLTDGSSRKNVSVSVLTYLMLYVGVYSLQHPLTGVLVRQEWLHLKNDTNIFKRSNEVREITVNRSPPRPVNFLPLYMLCSKGLLLIKNTLY